MRPEPMIGAESYRVQTSRFQSPTGASWGWFERGPLRILSSGSHHDGEFGEWEHVSVSRADRCPTWDEMCLVKDMFWHEQETVVQFHPAKSDYVQNHPFCLHLWKFRGGHRLPPSILVGIKEGGSTDGSDH